MKAVLSRVRAGAAIVSVLIVPVALGQMIEMKMHRIPGAAGQALYQALGVPEQVSNAGSGGRKSFATRDKSVSIVCVEDRYCAIGVSLARGANEGLLTDKGVVGRIQDPVDAGRLYEALNVPVLETRNYSIKSLRLADETRIYCAAQHTRFTGGVSCSISMPAARK
jgi:hypothetical protein